MLNPTTPEPIKGSIQPESGCITTLCLIRGTSFVFIPCIFIGGTYTFSLISLSSLVLWGYLIRRAIHGIVSILKQRSFCAFSSSI
jgi:hypothetical protein